MDTDPRPVAPPPGTPRAVVPAARLLPGRALAVEWRDAEDRRVRALVLRAPDGSPRAYLNDCPHLGVPLDTRAGGTFFEEDGRFLVCSFHGALFLPDTGACVAGPCRGESLAPLACAEQRGEIVVFAPDPEPAP